MEMPLGVESSLVDEKKEDNEDFWQLEGFDRHINTTPSPLPEAALFWGRLPTRRYSFAASGPCPTPKSKDAPRTRANTAPVRSGGSAVEALSIAEEAIEGPGHEQVSEGGHSSNEDSGRRDVADEIGEWSSAGRYSRQERDLNVRLRQGRIEAGEIRSLKPLAGNCGLSTCSQTTVFRCRRCRNVFYCCRDHQRKDWQVHRKECKKGMGPPPPRLSRLVVRAPQPTPSPSPRAAATPSPSPTPLHISPPKAVGWADSASSFADNILAPLRGQDDLSITRAAGKGGSYGHSRQLSTPGPIATRASTPSVGKKAQVTQAGQTVATPGKVGWSSETNQASRASEEDFTPYVRSTRGGTSWTVPNQPSLDCSGSAEVWPAPPAGLLEGGIAAQAAEAARRREKNRLESGHASESATTEFQGRGVGLESTFLSPAFPASCSPDRALSASDIDILAEMGFDRHQAIQALRSTRGDVERAAEWLLSGGDIGRADTSDSLTDGGLPTFGPHPQPPPAPNTSTAPFFWEPGIGTPAEPLNDLCRLDPPNADAGVGIDDDMITNADATDPEAMDLSQFWSWKDSGGETAHTIPLEDVSVGDMGTAARDKDEQQDAGQMVTSYEDLIGGAPVNVLIFYRSSPHRSHTSETTATVFSVSPSRKITPADGRSPDVKPPPFATAANVLASDDKERAPLPHACEGNGNGVLTIILRPLPCTAPVSLASDSSGGNSIVDGAEDRQDHGGGTEHWAVLTWEEAEAIVQQYESSNKGKAADLAISGRAFSTTSSMTASTAIESNLSLPNAGMDLDLKGFPEANSWPKPPPPAPPASPTWHRKTHVSILIASLLERSESGCYRLYAPQGKEETREDGSWDGRSPILSTRERTRTQSLPVRGRRDNELVHDTTSQRHLAPQQTVHRGADKEETAQVWECQACTFLNKDSDFVTACEVCATRRPRTNLTNRDPTLALKPGGAGNFKAGLMEESSMAPHDGIESDDGTGVDGILGGVSPGGPSPSPPTCAAQPSVDWEGGAWDGFGSVTFGDSPVESPQRWSFHEE